MTVLPHQLQYDIARMVLTLAYIRDQGRGLGGAECAAAAAKAIDDVQLRLDFDVATVACADLAFEEMQASDTLARVEPALIARLCRRPKLKLARVRQARTSKRE